MEKIINLLKQIRSDADYANCSDYIAEGLLDSFEIMELIDLIEDHYNVSIGGRDIIPENFMNIHTIQALITKNGGTL